MNALIRVVFNQKGGVGKSSLTANLAACAGEMGAKTLLIDLDPQGNLGHYLLGDTPTTHGIFEFFDQQLNFSFSAKSLCELAQATPFKGLSLLASHPELGELAAKLEARYKMFKLKEALETIRGEFDEIWIDTPPALNFFTRSALIAADRCVIPFDCDTFSKNALYSLMENVEEIRHDHNHKLFIEGILVNQFQARAALPSRLVEELEAERLPVCRTRLSSSVKMRESHLAAKPMIYFDSRHKLSTEFRALYRELSATT